MIAKVTTLIDKYLVMGLGVLLAAVLAFGAWQTWSLSSARNELKDATARIESLEISVASKQTQIEMRDLTISILGKRNDERLKEQTTFMIDLQGVLNAPAEENQNPVDDVLCRAVSGTKCVRTN